MKKIPIIIQTTKTEDKYSKLVIQDVQILRP